MNNWIMRFPLMDEAGAEGGGAPTETTAETTAELQPATTEATNDTPKAAETTATEDPKPFLGEEKPKANDEKKPDEQPKPASEADYLAKVVKDEALLGTDKNVQLDQNLVKAMIPEAQKLGVSPETMGRLANALAKAQLESGREAQRERIEYFNRMKEESLKKYAPNDFAQINAGIDHWFKPGGVMNNVIRNSELGADPEFLALMHYLGSKRVMDSLQGSSDASGEDTGDPNGIGGISKIW